LFRGRFKKKGGIALGSIPAELFAFAVLAVVLLFFFVLFYVQGCGNSNAASLTAVDLETKFDSDIVLLNYLRTPITVGGVDLAMADSVDFNFNPVYKDIIKGESDKIRRKGDNYIWCRKDCAGQRGSYADPDMDFVCVADSYYLPTINYSIVEVEAYRLR